MSVLSIGASTRGAAAIHPRPVAARRGAAWSTTRRVSVTRGLGATSLAVRASEASASTTSSGDEAGEAGPNASEAEVMSWAPEVINGRLAMVGMAVGAQVEAGDGVAMVDQLQQNAVGVVLLAAMVTWASITPFTFNPQAEYDANPASLEGKTGMSGFLCMDELNLKPDVELAHGRLAMVGIVGTVLVELVKGSPVF